MTTFFFISFAALLFLALIFIIGLLRVVFSIPTEKWAEANELSGSVQNALLGEVETDRDGLPDPRVAKGEVWNEATKQWLPQGKLSDEYLNSLVN